MNCPSCGSELPATAKFCGSCGFQLTVSAAPAAPVAAMTSSSPSSLSSPDSKRSYDEIATTPLNFTLGDVLSESWELTKPNLGLLIGVHLVAGLLFLASYLVGVGPIIVGGPLFGGVTIIGLRIAAGRPVEFAHLFDGFRRFLPLALAAFVAGVITGVGFIFLILPGIYFAFAFMFAPHLIIDRDEEFWPALMGSMKVVNGHFGTILLFALVLGALSIVASIPLGLGYILFAPFASVASVVLYKRLFGIAGGAEGLAG